jgi:hypothetical protein
VNTPDPELMHLYGTDVHYLEKVGAFKDVLRLAAPVAWLGLLAHNRSEDEQQRREAALLTAAMRVAEAERMRPALEGFYGRGVPRPPAPENYEDPQVAIDELESFGKLSSVVKGVGRSLALLEMRKLAVPNEWAPQIGMPNNSRNAATSVQPVVRGGPYRTPAPQPPAEAVQRVVRGGPAPAPQPSTSMRINPNAGPITSIHDPRFQAAPGFVAGEGLSDFNTSPWAANAPKLQQRAAKAGMTSTFTPTPGAPHPTSGLPRAPKPGVPKPGVPKAGGKPWISGKTIGKGLGVLGIAGLAYGGYKLLNKAKQTAETHQYGNKAWGQQRPALYTGVGEYGHPVY